ncbi:PKD domain-containing protein [Pedobacter nutrimenti]|uniref:PKD domain-containing protein n=1 Tax=Pedobacter nutrimenti TaxID=1241337 RepID=A0A318U678_9SPHI|nr:PKD domain-containing protein [Pedobacter nutrimenti]PYF68431.1 hypothetical protein B0O44_11215 [Pedobacter nutrimenti]
MKRSFFIILIATGIVAGCDKREDYFVKNALPPDIGIQRGDQLFLNLSDSVKVIRADQKYYPIELKLGSVNSEINSLTYQITQGKGEIEYREKPISGNSLPSEYNTVIVKYIPESLGQHQIQFTATNRFGAKQILNTRILFFNNIPPIAALKIDPTDNPKEFIINGEGSTSGDAKFGGYLVKYAIKVNDQEFILKSPKMHYIFPQSGEYTITLKVYDNDGASNEVQQKLIVKE